MKVETPSLSRKLEGLFSSPQPQPDGQDVQSSPPFTQEGTDLSPTPKDPAIKAIGHVVRLATAIDDIPPDEIIKHDSLCRRLTRNALWDIVRTPGGVSPGVLCTYRGYLLYILDRVETKPELKDTAVHTEVSRQVTICENIIDLMQPEKKHPVVDQELKAQYNKSIGIILAVVNKIGSIKDINSFFKEPRFLTPEEKAQRLLQKWGVEISDLAGAFDTIEAMIPLLPSSARETFMMLNGYISTIDNFARVITCEGPEESLPTRRQRYEKMIKILT